MTSGPPQPEALDVNPQSPDPDHWRQLLLTADTPDHVDTLLTELAPVLQLLAARGAGCWWIRKGDTLRLRLRRPTRRHLDTITTTARQQGAHVHSGIYEPETPAFGGSAGIEIAHRWACHDAHHLTGHLTRHRRHLYRCEMFLVLATRLLRAAGLDLEEQGDVWARVAAYRPPPDIVTAPTRRAVRHLIFSGTDTTTSPLRHVPAWSDAAETTGRDLAGLAGSGQLTRGLRAVLANVLLFTANRHGIHSPALAVLSTAAHRVIFQEDHHMTPTPETLDPADPAVLRDRLADTIADRGGFHGPDSPVERAFRTVFRHDFLPATPLATVYAPQPVVTKRDIHGQALSSASSPPLVATMLEQLAVRPGENILEIGAATGFNAALLAELVGPHGHVVTIEYDQDLTDGARDAISRTGYADRVEVRCGDGAFGAPDRAPFDAVIVTAGAVDVPPAWWDQLTDTGRIVVPLQLHPAGLTCSLGLHRAGPNTATSTRQEVCGFVPMRGRSAAVATRTRLADDILLDHAPTDTVDTAGLAPAVAAAPTWQQWTGMTFGTVPGSVLHLDLWLATQQPIPFGRLVVSDDVRTAGVADPARRWSGATLFRRGSLAYLQTRAAAHGEEEIGVAGHGPDAAQLGGELVELTRTWHAGPRLHEPTVTITRNGDTVGRAVHW